MQDALIGAGSAWKRCFRGIRGRTDVARRAATFEKASSTLPDVCHRGPSRNSAAQIRVGKDEIDRLILRTESGRPML